MRVARAKGCVLGEVEGPAIGQNVGLGTEGDHLVVAAGIRALRLRKEG